jgi:hypothetical protein
MSDVHVHIRRLVVDAGAEGLDTRTLPGAIEAALSARVGARGTRAERPRVPSTGDAIADAIANHVTPVTQRTGGGRA